MEPSADLLRRLDWPRDDPEALLRAEWLVTNGLGGFASSTIVGVSTRRYHGVLVAALGPPAGRAVMLDDLDELIVGAAHARSLRPKRLVDFRLELGLPVWRYEVDGLSLEKRVFMPRHQNTTCVRYVVDGASARLRLRPKVHFRGLEAPVSALLPVERYRASITASGLEVAGPELPPVRLHVDDGQARFVSEPTLVRHVMYRLEAVRGYDHEGRLWSPGFFDVELRRDRPIAVVASTEAWPTLLTLDPETALRNEQDRRRDLLDAAPERAREGFAAELVLAADAFVIMPPSRAEETPFAGEAADAPCSLIAGYHWFEDWGRDAMISLEGLLLRTGRCADASDVLTSFARSVREGLIPNRFPEGAREGRYETADATLWFFHALDRYVTLTGDRTVLRRLLPHLTEIVDHHLRGTRFGIHADPRDGLLSQGYEAAPLTWMDARFDDTIVTPRRGKAVEVNALWFQALRLLARWQGEERGARAARETGARAVRVARSFHERFWCAERGHLFDVVDGEQGDDPTCRPNQLLALSLPIPVLTPERWAPVFEAVRRSLLTPMGLRSLAPSEPDYHARYFGHLHARDEAYHQGTVWPWLIGPYVDAYLKVHPGDRAGARALLAAFPARLGAAGIGSISEICDGEAPYLPRGCVAQAWSVAEVLRAWLITDLLDRAGGPSSGPR